MTTQKLTLGIVIATAAIFLAGCTPEAQDKYGEAGKDVNQAATKTGEAVKTDAAESGEAIKEGAEKTGAAVKEGAEAAGTAVKKTATAAGAVVGAVGDKIGEGTDEVRTSVMVKTAIANTKDLKIDDFTVTVNGKVATLKGSASKTDKDRAGVLAKQSLGPEYKVQNDIVAK